MTSEMDDLFQLGAEAEQKQVEEQQRAYLPEEEKTIDGAPPHLVEAFCASLSRLALGQRLYAADNKLVGLMRQRVFDAWSMCCAHGKGVGLDLNGSAMLYHDIEVFNQAERDTIASRLFDDGIRRLVFNASLDVEELTSFLTIFDKGRWQRETDCADRIWILDLKGIRYHAVDGFDELVKETRGRAQTQMAAALDQFTGQASAMKRASEGVGAEEEQPWGPNTRVALDPDGLRALYNELIAAPDIEREEAVFWGRDEEARDGALFDDFFSIVGSVVDEDDVGLEGADKLFIVENALRAQLVHDPGEMATRIERAFEMPAPMGPLVKQAWQNIVDPRFFTELIGGAAPGSKRQQALSYLMEKYLRPTPEQIVATVLERQGEPVSCVALIDMMHEFEDDPMKYWNPQAKSLSIAILELISQRLRPRQLATRSGVAFLQFLWTSPDPVHVELGIRLTPSKWLVRQRDRLLACLEEPVESLRLAATDALRQLKDPSTGIYVLNILRHALERELSEREIRTLLHALMVIGGDRYVPFLEQSLGPLAKNNASRFGFGRRATGHHNPLGDEEVLRALSRHGSPRALELLKAAFNNGSPEMKSFIGRIRQDPDADLNEPPPAAAPAPSRRVSVEQATPPPSAAVAASDVTSSDESGGDEEGSKALAPPEAPAEGGRALGQRIRQEAFMAGVKPSSAGSPRSVSEEVPLELPALEAEPPAPVERDAALASRRSDVAPASVSSGQVVEAPSGAPGLPTVSLPGAAAPQGASPPQRATTQPTAPPRRATTEPASARATLSGRDPSKSGFGDQAPRAAQVSAGAASVRSVKRIMSKPRGGQRQAQGPRQARAGESKGVGLARPSRGAVGPAEPSGEEEGEGRGNSLLESVTGLLRRKP